MIEQGKTYTFNGSDSAYFAVELAGHLFLRDLNRSNAWQSGRFLQGYAEGYLVTGQMATYYGYDIRDGILIPWSLSEPVSLRIAEFVECETKTVIIKLDEIMEKNK